MEGNYGVGDFQTEEKGANVVTMEEKGAVWDGGSTEGCLGIFEKKEAQVQEEIYAS